MYTNYANAHDYRVAQPAKNYSQASGVKDVLSVEDLAHFFKDTQATLERKHNRTILLGSDSCQAGGSICRLPVMYKSVCFVSRSQEEYQLRSDLLDSDRPVIITSDYSIWKIPEYLLTWENIEQAFAWSQHL